MTEIERSCLNGLSPDTPVRVPSEDSFGGRDYQVAPELREVGDLLLRDPGKGLHQIVSAEVSLRWLWRRKGGKQANKSILAKCMKVSGYAHYFSDADFVVEVAADLARELALTHWQLEAVLFHELQHIDATWDDEKQEWEVRVKTHEVEMFAAEIERYGLWSLDLRRIANAFEQMPMFTDPKKPARARKPRADVTAADVLAEAEPDIQAEMAALDDADGSTTTVTFSPPLPDAEPEEVRIPAQERAPDDAEPVLDGHDADRQKAYQTFRDFHRDKNTERTALESRLAVVEKAMKSDAASVSLMIERDALFDAIAEMDGDGLTDAQRALLRVERTSLEQENPPPAQMVEDIRKFVRMQEKAELDGREGTARALHVRIIAREDRLSAMDPPSPAWIAFRVGNHLGHDIRHDPETGLYLTDGDDAYAEGLIEQQYAEMLKEW